MLQRASARKIAAWFAPQFGLFFARVHVTATRPIDRPQESPLRPNAMAALMLYKLPTDRFATISGQFDRLVCYLRGGGWA